jgi:hypothetical protein
MKKIQLLLIGFLGFNAVALAQEAKIQQRIDNQYLDLSHKAFIYQVSPQAKKADLLILNAGVQEKRDFLNGFNQMRRKGALLNNPDTTWRFEEYKAPDDSMYRPSSLGWRWTEGSIESGTYFTSDKAYNWNPDSLELFPERFMYSKVYDSGNDTTETLYFNYGSKTPYYGLKTAFIDEPTQGADYETYSESYYPENGWLKYAHLLTYQNEQGWDTLRIEERYDPETMEYYPESEQRNISNENYVLSSNRAFRFDGSTFNWNYSYTKLGDGGRTIYQVSKQWNNEKEQLAGRDSVHYIYNNDVIEGRQYSWADSQWVASGLYKTFQNPNEETQVDSIILYSVYPDSMDNNGGPVIDGSINKTEFDYDAAGNQTEVRIYRLDEGELVLSSKAVTVYELFGETYQLVLRETFSVDFVTGELYKTGFSERFYDEEGVNTGDRSFNLNAAGDTTFGNGNEYRTLEDGTRIYITLQWDFNIKKLVVQYYRAYPTAFFEDGYTNQSTYYDVIRNSGTRSLNVGGNYPGVFNDGPIPFTVGDTLSFFVSAVNLDLSIPEVSVTNMPATATFDPETKKFWWIVDEENPGPMTYTATNKNGSSEAVVYFANIDVGDQDGGTSVSNEGGDFNPDQFSLSQNYPNPFNPTTNISFNLPQASEVSLKVYNMLGQGVASLVNGKKASGFQTVTFDASVLSSGMYIYRIQAGNFVETRKMMLIK